MGKKIVKYFGIILGLMSFLPLLVAPFVYNIVIAGKTTGTDVKLFEELDGFKVLVKDFQPFWITLFKILVIAMVVVAVLLLLVSILYDLKIVKNNAIEKFLASILAILGIITLVVVVINLFVNNNITTTEVLGNKVKSGSGLIANVIGWLAPVFAIGGGALAYYGANEKSTKKKRK